MRYWMYKCNADGGPAGFCGDWATDVFNSKRPVEWGGHYSTRSAEVARYFNEDTAEGDVVVAYQTDTKSIIGLCRVTQVTGAPGARKLWLQPIEKLAVPFRIHENKAGTSLAHAPSVNGRVMLRELHRREMSDLVSLVGAPRRVLLGLAARTSHIEAAGLPTLNHRTVSARR